MADLKVRRLDDGVAAVLKERARRKGVSLEEEVRQTLAASVAANREALIRRAAALRAAILERREGAPTTDSTRVIREERDAWG
ncbi:MAG TPA: hypothetical protein VFG47_18625 [Geminicoccaceae bacterium]|nr:hypothetical protein [Geminicoccaceae bacterium]